MQRFLCDSGVRIRLLVSYLPIVGGNSPCRSVAPGSRRKVRVAWLPVLQRRIITACVITALAPVGRQTGDPPHGFGLQRGPRPASQDYEGCQRPPGWNVEMAGEENFAMQCVAAFCVTGVSKDRLRAFIELEG